MKKPRIMLGMLLIILLIGSIVGTYRFFNKPEKGLLIELPNPDQTMGRSTLASWLVPKYRYYVQVQVMTREGFRTIYLGSSPGKVLIPRSNLSEIKRSWEDVNPAVLVDVWIVEPETEKTYEVGTFSTRLTDNAIRGLQTFSPSIKNFKANLHQVTVSSGGGKPIQPARGYFAGYRWRTKRTYLREDDFPNGMYLPLLILDNTEGTATVMGMYKVETKESSSSASGISIGF